jgi:glycosyltransferase involved in cell wall biosynthesis
MTVSAKPEIEFAPASGTQYPRVLYLSLEGMLQPLGRSQVLSYVKGLAGLGFLYTLLSMERAADLADAPAVQQVEEETRVQGIEWRRLQYRSSGAATDVLRNWWKLWRTASRILASGDFGLVHARSYVAAFVALLLSHTRGVPYLFDMRGYWVDERIEEGRWFRNRLSIALAKRLERALVRRAAAVVTLTELQADDLCRQGFTSAEHLMVVPTCANYNDFTLDPDSTGVVAAEVRDRLRRKLVVGFVGSLNDSYLVREGFRLFRYLREHRDDVHLLCVTRQVDQVAAAVRTEGVPDDAFTVAAARHEDMPAWLGCMDWGLLLVKESLAKRGSMPTKLAEFLAAGVRPIQYGCNSEVSRRVAETDSGIVVRDLSDAGLKAAAALISATPLNTTAVLRARETTRAYFDLESGIQKYACLLRRLLISESLKAKGAAR